LPPFQERLLLFYVCIAHGSNINSYDSDGLIRMIRMIRFI
jgi:hypothetical protein